MNILGLSYSGNHESAACLVRDGELVFAIAEERLSRIKQDAGFPVLAIKACLEFAGLKLDDIDHIALNWPRSMAMRLHDLKLIITGQWPRSRMRFDRLIFGMLQSIRHKGGEVDILRAIGQPKNPIHFVNHHLAHALSAYCLSGFEESGVMIVDGRGATEATTLWHAQGGRIKLLETYEYPNSLGVFYAGITDMLGFQPLSDEWKVMGLAAYGKGADRFGLIHCDLRLANLLIDGKAVKVIDFDDCGFGWYMYDAATPVSFYEHEPQVPGLIESWKKGYRRVIDLSKEDEAEIPTFVMLRRLLLVAWIGSHHETDLAKSMGLPYTEGTIGLCEAYLKAYG